MKNTTLTLITLGLASALSVGCGGSDPGHRFAGTVGAAVSTRTLGPLAQDTVALPGIAEGQAAAAVGEFALVTGGATANEGASTRVTELELTSGQTRPRPDRMLVARSGHVLHLSAQGEWLALGGVDAAGTPLSSIERYDFAEEAWVLEERTLPIAGRLTSVVSDGHLWLGAAGHAFVEIFGLEGLTWTGSFPLQGAPSEAPTLIHLAGRGELIYAHSEFPAFVEFETGFGASFAANFVPQGGSVLPVSDFGVLFVGGRDAEGRSITRPRYLEVLATEVVEVGPELPPVEGASVAWLADGSVLVAGGRSEGALSDRVLRFDLEGVVERLAPLGEARERMTLLQSAGRVALIGGRGQFGPSALIDLFSFTELAPTQAFAEAARNRQRKLDQLATISDLRERRGAAEEELSDLIAKVGSTQAALDQATSRRDALTLELRRAEAARLRVEAEVASLRGEEQRLIGERQRLEAQARRDQQAFISVQGELQRVQGDLDQARAEASRQQAASSGLQTQLTQAQGQLSAARQDLTRLEAQSAQRAAQEKAAAQTTASQPAIAAPVSTPSYGAVVAIGSARQATTPQTTTTQSFTRATGVGVKAQVGQTQTTQSSAPTTNYGGVFTWDSILARLNGNR
jgi:hypothetical protein